MKRRTFLATAGAAVVAPFAPALAFEQTPQYFRIETKKWLLIIRARAAKSGPAGLAQAREWAKFTREMFHEHGNLELYVNHDDPTPRYKNSRPPFLRTQRMPSVALYVAHRIIEVVDGEEIILKDRSINVT